jgi:subtilase family serine protease
MLRRIMIATTALAAVFALAGIATAAPVRAAACGTPTGPNRIRCAALSVHRPLQRVVTRPDGYGPSQLRAAYGVASLAAVDPTTTQTVGIVDAYSDPNLAADLAAYRSYFGLPACTTASGCLRIVAQTGSTRLPAASPAWGLETSLDAEMVSAICPRCHIAVVEAASATYADLGAAENEAVKLGAHVISNSWGGTDSARDPNYDAAYFNHPGVAIVAATGDSGYAAGPIYPSTSPHVIAVGGTTLSAAAQTARGYTEAAWSGGGSGCSVYEPMPAWQAVVTNAVATCRTRRAVADVAADANPSTGVAVYDSYGYPGWYPGMIGGTSLAAPIISGIYGLAGNAPASAADGAQGLYAAASYSVPNLFDITGGSNGTCSIALACAASTGWDGPTGLGAPDGIAGF